MCVQLPKYGVGFLQIMSLVKYVPLRTYMLVTRWLHCKDSYSLR